MENKQTNKQEDHEREKNNVCNRNMVVEPTCNSGRCEADAGG